jgi:hypothetical protein
MSKKIRVGWTAVKTLSKSAAEKRRQTEAEACSPEIGNATILWDLVRSRGGTTARELSVLFGAVCELQGWPISKEGMHRLLVDTAAWSITPKTSDEPEFDRDPNRTTASLSVDTERALVSFLFAISAIVATLCADLDDVLDQMAIETKGLKPANGLSGRSTPLHSLCALTSLLQERCSYTKEWARGTRAEIESLSVCGSTLGGHSDIEAKRNRLLEAAETAHDLVALGENVRASFSSTDKEAASKRTHLVKLNVSDAMDLLEPHQGSVSTRRFRKLSVVPAYTARVLIRSVTLVPCTAQVPSDRLRTTTESIARLVRGVKLLERLLDPIRGDPWDTVEDVQATASRSFARIKPDRNNMILHVLNAARAGVVAQFLSDHNDGIESSFAAAVYQMSMVMVTHSGALRDRAEPPRSLYKLSRPTSSHRTPGREFYWSIDPNAINTVAALRGLLDEHTNPSYIDPMCSVAASGMGLVASVVPALLSECEMVTSAMYETAAFTDLVGSDPGPQGDCRRKAWESILLWVFRPGNGYVARLSEHGFGAVNALSTYVCIMGAACIFTRLRYIELVAIVMRSPELYPDAMWLVSAIGDLASLVPDLTGKFCPPSILDAVPGAWMRRTVDKDAAFRVLGPGPPCPVEEIAQRATVSFSVCIAEMSREGPPANLHVSEWIAATRLVSRESVYALSLVLSGVVHRVPVEHITTNTTDERGLGHDCTCRDGCRHVFMTADGARATTGQSSGRTVTKVDCPIKMAEWAITDRERTDTMAPMRGVLMWAETRPLLISLWWKLCMSPVVYAASTVTLERAGSMISQSGEHTIDPFVVPPLSNVCVRGLWDGPSEIRLMFRDSGVPSINCSVMHGLLMPMSFPPPTRKHTGPDLVFHRYRDASMAGEHTNTTDILVACVPTQSTAPTERVDLWAIMAMEMLGSVLARGQLLKTVCRDGLMPDMDPGRDFILHDSRLPDVDNRTSFRAPTLYLRRVHELTIVLNPWCALFNARLVTEEDFVSAVVEYFCTQILPTMLVDYDDGITTGQAIVTRGALELLKTARSGGRTVGPIKACMRADGYRRTGLSPVVCALLETALRRDTRSNRPGISAMLDVLEGDLNRISRRLASNGAGIVDVCRWTSQRSTQSLMERIEAVHMRGRHDRSRNAILVTNANRRWEAGRPVIPIVSLAMPMALSSKAGQAQFDLDLETSASSFIRSVLQQVDFTFADMWYVRLLNPRVGGDDTERMRRSTTVDDGGPCRQFLHLAARAVSRICFLVCESSCHRCEMHTDIDKPAGETQAVCTCSLGTSHADLVAERPLADTLSGADYGLPVPEWFADGGASWVRTMLGEIDASEDDPVGGLNGGILLDGVNGPIVFDATHSPRKIGFQVSVRCKSRGNSPPLPHQDAAAAVTTTSDVISASATSAILSGGVPPVPVVGLGLDTPPRSSPLSPGEWSTLTRPPPLALNTGGMRRGSRQSSHRVVEGRVECDCPAWQRSRVNAHRLVPLFLVSPTGRMVPNPMCKSIPMAINGMEIAGKLAFMFASRADIAHGPYPLSESMWRVALDGPRRSHPVEQNDIIGAAFDLDPALVISQLDTMSYTDATFEQVLGEVPPLQKAVSSDSNLFNATCTLDATLASAGGAAADAPMWARETPRGRQARIAETIASHFSDMVGCSTCSKPGLHAMWQAFVQGANQRIPLRDIVPRELAASDMVAMLGSLRVPTAIEIASNLTVVGPDGFTSEMGLVFVQALKRLDSATLGRLFVFWTEHHSVPSGGIRSMKSVSPDGRRPLTLEVNYSQEPNKPMSLLSASTCSMVLWIDNISLVADPPETPAEKVAFVEDCIRRTLDFEGCSYMTAETFTDPPHTIGDDSDIASEDDTPFWLPRPVRQVTDRDEEGYEAPGDVEIDLDGSSVDESEDDDDEDEYDRDMLEPEITNGAGWISNTQIREMIGGILRDRRVPQELALLLDRPGSPMDISGIEDIVFKVVVDMVNLLPDEVASHAEADDPDFVPPRDRSPEV